MDPLWMPFVITAAPPLLAIVPFIQLYILIALFFSTLLVCVDSTWCVRKSKAVRSYPCLGEETLLVRMLCVVVGRGRVSRERRRINRGDKKWILIRRKNKRCDICSHFATQRLVMVTHGCKAYVYSSSVWREDVKAKKRRKEKDLSIAIRWKKDHSNWIKNEKRQSTWWVTNHMILVCVCVICMLSTLLGALSVCIKGSKEAHHQQIDLLLWCTLYKWMCR